MAIVAKLVNAPDCGSGISRVRAPSVAPLELTKKHCFFFIAHLLVRIECKIYIKCKNREILIEMQWKVK